ncbi:MAG: bifunctional 2-polyprenyl-6-hydroxyphenol methylase/3-demethylubiquinol 3-O-methyltransferase UbiG [Rickettsiella sp.]|nr:bifunctional 2-polyprenyl-6-hydroxyphenol methylase/3-demethylubiquinol 3-O-methyltransferase UbiG [Rickettsiella sp.]
MLFPNSDPLEIDKFSMMAEEWWNAKGPCKPLHDINPTRLAFIKSLVPFLQEQKIIDIGCGGGLLTEELAVAKTQVTGIDKSDTLIKIARRHAQQNGLIINYLTEDAETLSKKQREYFDFACCMELLEHVPDPASLIKACGDLVKPNGWLFFSTINRTTYAYLAAIIGAEYLLKLLPQGTHHYEKFIRPSELASVARKLGFKLKKLKGIHYNPFTRSAALTNSIRINYIAAFQKET